MVIIIIILEQMKIIPFTNTKYIKNKYSIKMFSLHILIKAKMVFFGNDQCHNISSYEMPSYIKIRQKLSVNQNTRMLYKNIDRLR